MWPHPRHLPAEVGRDPPERDEHRRHVHESDASNLRGGPLGRASSWAGRAVAFLYGVVAYAAFFVTILYAIGFIGGFLVPKTIDSGTAASVAEAIIVNLLLMSLFAVQHSVMARKGFKQWWTRFVPKAVERSTYVLLSSLVLLLLFWQWRPLPAVVWKVENQQLAMIVTAVSHIGWVIVFDQHVPDQSLRAVRAASGRQQPVRPADAGAALPRAAVLQVRAPPALSRLHHRVLGGAA